MLEPGTLPSRLIAILLLLLIVMVAYQAVVQPVIDLYHDNVTAIADKRDRLERFRRLAAERQPLLDQMADVERDQAVMAGYIAKDSDAMAVAALQDQTSGAISAIGGEVKSVELLPPKAVDGQPVLRRVGLRIRFAASIRQLAGVIQALEDAEPYLFIEELLAVNAGGQPTSTQPQRSPRLDVSLDIFGYAQASELGGQS